MVSMWGMCRSWQIICRGTFVRDLCVLVAARLVRINGLFLVLPAESASICATMSTVSKKVVFGKSLFLFV